MELSVDQNISLRPEFNSVENDPFDDALGDLFPLPGADDEDDDDNPDDDSDDEGDNDDKEGDDNDLAPGSGSYHPGNLGEVLRDDALNVELGVRGSTQFGLEYELANGLDISAKYGMFYQPDRLRHGWTTQLGYDLPLDSDNFRVGLRASLRHTGEQREEEFRLRSGTNLGLRAQYRRHKQHRPYVGFDLAGRWRDEEYNQDRYRARVGLDYRPDGRNYNFRLEYRFTQRIGRDRYSHDLRFQYRASF